MRLPRLLTNCLISVVIASSYAYAWGPGGHQTVGAIADQMIVGTPAAGEVKKILGNITLQDASVWADCAEGIDPNKNYTYQSVGKHPECKIYETLELEAEMSDFVRRNDKNCNPKPGEESCHKQYHYTDVAIQHEEYDRKFVGTGDDDVVNALVAAIHVLKGDPSPAPFKFKDKREALLVLVHYVGDIHQPLHVGAVYLDKNGKIVDPDTGTYDTKTDTHGGNSILVKGKKLHAMWDGIPKSLTPSHINAALLTQVKAIPVTKRQIYEWPTSWANDTLAEARLAFEGIKFSNLQNGHWNATLPAKYSSKMNTIKKTQLIKAGAHLAQLLQAIWP